MQRIAHFAAVAGAAVAVAFAVAVPAAADSPNPATSAVFVQTDNVAGNQIVAFDRNPDGTLTQAGTDSTGGLGGSLGGAVVDRTASQGALAADRGAGLLYAVNAGSDTVSVFGIDGDVATLRQVVSSDGAFPVSVTVHGDQVFVLNARDGGSIQGFVRRGGGLVAVPAWHRELNLPQSATPAQEFTHTPGQIAFTPDGRHLVVTTKATTNSILVYTIERGTTLSSEPVTRAESGTVPFAVAFDGYGQLEIADAGTNAVSAYDVAHDGRLTPLGSTPTGQRATCWLAASGNLLAAANAGSASVSTLTASAAGAASFIADAGTAAGTVDASFTPDGTRLYVQTGRDGGIDAFTVAAGGTLTAVGSVSVPDAAGAEGIVAW